MPKPQPRANGAAARNGFRPPIDGTSLRGERARPFDIQTFSPCLPTSQLSTFHAAALFVSLFAIDQETVKARFPFVLPLIIGWTP